MSQVTLPDEGLEVLFGTHDENLRRMERAFGVQLAARGTELNITGDPAGAVAVEHLVTELETLAERGFQLKPNDVRTAVRVIEEDPTASLVEFFQPSGMLASVNRLITPRTLRQQTYLKAMIDFDIVVSIGPAGTGKTYLAVAMAAAYLLEKKVRRIVLARPAVEAGEKLGFLPGDLVEKVNPYLRPLYDALYDIIGYEKVGRMLERGIIEVAPIAFMRGRTLNDSFIILDEAQNTTSEQMKMFLTRIGFGSKAVINGDVTQVDLPQGRRSGLREAQVVLADIAGIRFFRFDERDVVRHSLVQQVISAYERHEQRQRAERDPVEAGSEANSEANSEAGSEAGSAPGSAAPDPEEAAPAGSS
ncbi:MAG: PhoH family protein [Acidobacteriota bacterium]|jgi:phosphate starvation-inducible PhoH-like protein